MCSNFEGVVNTTQFAEAFDVDMPFGGKASVWPAYESAFIRNNINNNISDTNQNMNKPEVNKQFNNPFSNQFSNLVNTQVNRQALIGKFGMVPAWAVSSPKYAKLGLKTYNARSETVADKPTYRDAWRQAQHCIVPAAAIYEPDWRSGKATPARIARADQQPLGIAGLWTSYMDIQGNEEIEALEVFSFTMLTINADTHPVFNQFHRPEDEKRMVVILQPSQFDAWLAAPMRESMALMQPLAAEELMVSYPKLGEKMGKDVGNKKSESPNKLLFN